MFAKLYVTSLLLLKCMYLLRSYVLCSYVLRSSTIVEGSIYCYKTCLLSAWPPWCNGYNTHLETEGSTDRIPANPTSVFTLAFIDISMREKNWQEGKNVSRREWKISSCQHSFLPAFSLQWLPCICFLDRTWLFQNPRWNVAQRAGKILEILNLQKFKISTLENKFWFMTIQWRVVLDFLFDEKAPKIAIEKLHFKWGYWGFAKKWIQVH